MSPAGWAVFNYKWLTKNLHTELHHPKNDMNYKNMNPKLDDKQLW